ncbi:hypothetical protein HII31_09319 [Pseudocercospora fuligena]|uniref:Uncharacterized protein n=1 Tax=Pseudocercospora fuligena TaxID=685502 RepID=A0A8H6RDY5_9PEZI|nr:hypothetical protein HII31_09319 [Pseudocercospora fuligena]
MTMEHLEDTRKFTTTWWRIKRTHRKDLNRLRNCEMIFKLNMQELLLPLKLDGTINQREHAILLASPKNEAWNRSDVQEALEERLSDCRDRYLSVLQEMESVVTKLAKSTMVDDAKFQQKVKERQDTVNEIAFQQGLGHLVKTANDHVSFEMKRITYSLTGFRREALIDEIESHNRLLSQFLQSNDRMAERVPKSRVAGSRSIKRSFRTSLGFWNHADRMFRLMKEAWKCGCAPLHCACLWLEEHSARMDIRLQLTLRFTSDQSSCASYLWNTRQLTMELREAELPSKLLKRAVRFQDADCAEESQNDTTPKDAPWAKDFIDIHERGLCSFAQVSQASSGESLGFLQDLVSDTTYELQHSSREKVVDAEASVCLADFFAGARSQSLLRTDRLTLAFVLASSFLRLYPTSWLPGVPAAELIRLPKDSLDGNILYCKPFVLAKFESKESLAQDDTPLVELGILLLQLCFNRTLEQHALWSQHAPNVLSPSMAMLRKAVASEWAKYVQREADIDYANAVNWCLRGSLRNAEWRVEFAQNVVQPLENCHKAALAAAGLIS